MHRTLALVFFSLCFARASAQTTLTFVEAQTGEPIAGLEVVLKYGKKRLASGTTNGEGKFVYPKTIDHFDVKILNMEERYESGPFNVALYPSFNPENRIGVRWSRALEDQLLKEMEERDQEEIRRILKNCGEQSTHKNSEVDGVEDAGFPGGPAGMQHYVQGIMRYPEVSIVMNEQGKVHVVFVVEADGSITSIAICKGVSSDLDREAKLLVMYMPRWSPGKMQGVRARTKCSLPINFSLY